MSQCYLVVLKGLGVFELQIQNVCKVIDDVNEFLTIRPVGAQGGPVGRIGLRNQAFTVVLEQLLVACGLHIVLLNLRKLLLEMRVESALGCLEMFLGFGDLGVHPLLSRKADVEGEHIVVPILAVGVLVHVPEFEIRLALTSGRCHLRILLLN